MNLLSKTYTNLKHYLNRVLFIPNSFFDVRTIGIVFFLVFTADFTYRFFIKHGNFLISIVSSMFYPMILAIVLFAYSRVLGNLKKELLIPRKWVNFGVTVVIGVIITEKLLYDFFLSSAGNLALVFVAFVTIVTFVFTSIMNMWMKISDKNLKILQDITNQETLYRALYEYTWQWLDWMNNVNVERDGIRTFIKSFHVQEAASFFDHYVVLTPYVVAYGSEETIKEYKNLMLQIVAMNNIRIDIANKGYVSDTEILKLNGRRQDCLLSLELLMVNMKAELSGSSEEEKRNLLDLIRSRDELKTLKDKILF